MAEQSELDVFKKEYETKFQEAVEREQDEESSGLPDCFLLMHTKPDGTINEVIGTNLKKSTDNMIEMHKRSSPDYEIIYMHRKIGAGYKSEMQEPKIFNPSEFTKRVESIKNHMEHLSNSSPP